MKSITMRETIIFASLLLSLVAQTTAFTIGVKQVANNFPQSNMITTSSLQAKNTNKNKKRLGGPRGAGRRGKPKRDGEPIAEEEEDEITIAEPKSFRKHMVKFERKDSLNPLTTCIVEINDQEWWENEDNKNPFGGKLWPSALAISEFFASLGSLKKYDLLEIGCGNGLVSIVSAQLGARVVASDISETVLKLTKIGWIETQKQMQKDQHEKTDSSEWGSLNIFPFDILAPRSLPLSKSSENRKIVTATSVMYEADLAAALAKRSFEACVRDSWVIIGDCPTGEREQGRNIFFEALDNLEEEKGVYFERKIIQSSVKSKDFNWTEKHVTIIHLNPPDDIDFDE